MSHAAAWILLIETLVAFALVFGLHSMRRRTSLVLSYASLTFMTFASWAVPHQTAVSVGPLEFYVESNVFFSAGLLNVFLLYVMDGPRAGRLGLSVVIGTGIAYTLLALLLHFQFPVAVLQESIFPSARLRSGGASIAASLADLTALGIIWEALQKKSFHLPLGLRVLLTLWAVLFIDTFIYLPIAWFDSPDFYSMLEGSLISRTAISLLYAPVVTAYLNYEARTFGLKLEQRPIFSILTREDLERQLASTQHSLRLGTEALWESEERYRQIVNDLPIMTFRFGTDGRVSYANRALCKYYGREVEDIIGEHVLGPIDRRERETLWAEVSSLTPDRPRVELFAHAYPSPDDRRVQRWVVRAIFDKKGTGLAFQAIGEDITDRAETEQRVRRLDTALRQTREYVALADEEGRLTYVNPALVQQSGRSSDELAGEQVVSLFVEEEETWRLAEKVRAGEIWTGRLKLKTEAERPRILSASLTPLTSDSLVGGGLVMVAHDLTDEIALQHRLQEVDKAEALGRMAAGVAHDFNNLLTIIWSCTELATTVVGQNSSPQMVLPLLEDIRQSTDRAAALARQLLTVGQKNEVHPEKLDLSIAVERTRSLLGRFVKKETRLVVDLAEEEATTLIDPSEFERLLINLVVNASDAIVAQGKITVRTEVRQLPHEAGGVPTAIEAGPHVVLVVEDDGSGMDQKTQERIFEPFFSTKGPGKGTGLGLATVYAIAKNAHGTIRVFSELGHGTRFEVLFPKATPMSTRPSSLPPSGRTLVIYCESDDELRERMSVVLELSGYDVLADASIETLLQKTSEYEGRKRVLLVDRVAVDQSGTLASQELKARFPDTPVVLISGQAGGPASIDYRRQDVNIVLNRNFSRVQLLEAVRRAVHLARV